MELLFGFNVRPFQDPYGITLVVVHVFVEVIVGPCGGLIGWCERGFPDGITINKISPLRPKLIIRRPLSLSGLSGGDTVQLIIFLGF